MKNLVHTALVVFILSLVAGCAGSPPAEVSEYKMPTEKEIAANYNDKAWRDRQLALASSHGRITEFRNQLAALACQPYATGSRKMYQAVLPAGCGIDNRQVVATGSHTGGANGVNYSAYTEELVGPDGKPKRALQARVDASEPIERVVAKEGLAMVRAAVPPIANNLTAPEGCDGDGYGCGNVLVNNGSSSGSVSNAANLSKHKATGKASAPSGSGKPCSYCGAGKD